MLDFPDRLFRPQCYQFFTTSRIQGGNGWAFHVPRGAKFLFIFLMGPAGGGAGGFTGAAGTNRGGGGGGACGSYLRVIVPAAIMPGSFMVRVGFGGVGGAQGANGGGGSNSTAILGVGGGLSFAAQAGGPGLAGTAAAGGAGGGVGGAPLTAPNHPGQFGLAVGTNGTVGIAGGTGAAAGGNATFDGICTPGAGGGGCGTDNVTRNGGSVNGVALAPTVAGGTATTINGEHGFGGGPRGFPFVSQGGAGGIGRNGVGGNGGNGGYGSGGGGGGGGTTGGSGGAGGDGWAFISWW